MKLAQRAACLIAVASLLATSARGADNKFLGLKEGTPNIQSAGPLAFGPEGVLFVGDPAQATVFALATGDRPGEAAKFSANIDNIDQKVASALGFDPPQVVINDLAVNPQSGNVYLSVSKKGTNAGPSIVRIDIEGKITALDLKNIPFSSAKLPDAPEDKTVQQGSRQINRRNESITDLAWVEGQILVSGLGAGESPSTVRAFTFPFSAETIAANIEIYHGAHGRVEDYAAIRTFVPFTINGEASVLAGFTCTPLVKIPLSKINEGKKTRGTTVAELGNRNKPLDMIAYKQGGKDYLLMANSARGTMKISTENLERADGISQKISGTAGQSYETVEELAGIVQLDKLTDQKAVAIIQKGEQLNLKTINLP